MNEINPIFVVSAIFLLSLLGAFVLFKFLKAYARIRRKGYQAGGALAGFLLIYGALYTSYDRIENARIEEAKLERQANEQRDATLNSQSWSITGTVVRGDTTVHNGIVVRLIPPVPATSSDLSGNFRLDNVHLKSPDAYPEIYVESQSYYPISYGLNRDNAVTDNVNQTIKLKDTIKLDRVKQ